MTKRRAEGPSLHGASPPHPSPQKKKMKKCLSVCDAEHECCVTDPNAHALFNTLIGERRRKRVRCSEDPEPHSKTAARGDGLSNAPGGVNTESRDGPSKATGGVNTESRESVSAGQSREAREMPSEERVRGLNMDGDRKAMHPDDGEDELCEFNTFQFWRTPLPALDLSVLDSPSTAELREASPVTEEMET